MGVALFWPLQGRLAQSLIRWLPERAEPQVLIAEVAPAQVAEPEPTRARYLNERALDSVESASVAVVQELGHLGRLSLEVICHALYLPVEQLAQARADEQLLQARPAQVGFDADQLYRRHIKGCLLYTSRCV